MAFPRFIPVVLLVALTCCSESGNDAEIRQKAKAYEEAYNQKDAKALSLLWADQGEYINPVSGEIVKGKAEIEKEFHQNFELNKSDQIKLHIESIAYPTSSEALETGTAVLMQDGKEVSRSAYKALYIKQNGTWLLEKIREIEILDPPKQNPQLKEMEWLIGDWVDEDEDASITSNFAWDRYKNFIIQQFSVETEGTFEIEGRQIIGWDPIEKKIRSWLFDSDGSFGEGIWKKNDKSWTLEMSQTLADGRKASSIQIYTPSKPGGYTWEAINREVDGDLLPDIAPIDVVRKKG